MKCMLGMVLILLISSLLNLTALTNKQTQEDFTVNGEGSLSGFSVKRTSMIHQIGQFTSLPLSWQTSGTITGSVDVVLTFPGNISSSSILNVYQRDHREGESQWKFIGVFDTESHGSLNSITIPNVTSLSSSTKGSLEWTISEIDPEPQLKLISFNAVTNDLSFVTIKWVTQSENDVSGFNILRSDSEEISKAEMVNISQINATNTTYEHTYFLVDTVANTNGVCYYWLQDIGRKGNVNTSGPIKVLFDANLESNRQKTEQISSLHSILRTQPNPNINVTYGVVQKGKVVLNVFNAEKKFVRTLLSEEKDAGIHTYTWNYKDWKGHKCAAGIYILEMSIGNIRSTLKVDLTK